MKLYRLYLLMYVFGLIVLLTDSSYPSIFGVDGTLFKKQTTKIQSEISAVRELTLNNNIKFQNEMNGLKSTIGELKLQIGQVNTEFSAKMTGLDKSINSSVSSGRDTINDTTLMKAIFDKIMDNSYKIIAAIFGFLLSLLGGVWGMLKYQSNMFNKIMQEKDSWIENLEKRNDAKANKLDGWQTRMIERQIK